MKLKILFILFISFFSLGLCNAQTVASKEQAKQWMKAVPVDFLENKGQMTDMNHQPVPFVLYKVEAPGTTVFITETGLTYLSVKSEEEKEEPLSNKEKKTGILRKDENMKLEWNRIDMTLQGASIKKQNVVRENESRNFSQYFFAHCPNGITDVHAYKKITIKNVYPYIDWVLYNSTEQGFKYDFVVHPGADYKQIELVYSSLNRLTIDEAGNLKIKTEQGTLTENAPVSFLAEKKISSQFIKTSNQKNKYGGYDTHIQFSIPDVTTALENDLIIDPQLTWGTYWGGNDLDGPLSICTDATNNFFITGYTGSTDFPTLDAGTYFYGVTSHYDAFILKFNNGGVLLWSTFYGGTGLDEGDFLDIDNSGNIFVTGRTESTDFPTQTAGTFFQGTNAGGEDVFVLKFDNFGNRLWATYYGGTSSEVGLTITVDFLGNVFVSGKTQSTDFPTQNAGTFFQGTFGGGYEDVFVLKFDNAGNRLWATYYGGSVKEAAHSIITDGTGNVFIVGQTDSPDFPTQNAGTFFQGTYGGGYDDAFILKFDNGGNRLWATFYGGNFNDEGGSVIVESTGNVFIMGLTRSTNFPVQNAGTFFQATNAGILDAFILKFDNMGNRLWATYYGGPGFESYISFDNLALDSCGNLYITFTVDTDSTTYPFPSCDGGYFDNFFSNAYFYVFISEFTSQGDLLWASYLSGDGATHSALAIDTNNNLLITGEWVPILGTSYPLANPGGGAFYDTTYNGSDDAYILKFSPIPLVVTTTSSNAICTCNGTATALIAGTCPYTYSWNTGQTTPTVSTLCAGTYTVTVHDSIRCATQTAIVTINDSIVPITITVNSPTICLGDTAILVATGATSYTWSAGTLVTAVNTATAAPITTAVYTVIGNSGLCADTAFATVTISAPPVITTSGDVTIAFGASTLLNSSGGISYTWSPPTGLNCTNCATPVANPLETTIYCVAVNDGVCIDTTCLTVNVESPCPSVGELKVPDAFSPNGDGNNDVFLLQGWDVCIKKFNIIIVDRWGEKVFQSNSPSINWDGTYKGKMLDPAVFVYFIEAEFSNTTCFKRKGNITLIR
jgi:gliding motility-associated-like protein